MPPLADDTPRATTMPHRDREQADSLAGPLTSGATTDFDRHAETYQAAVDAAAGVSVEKLSSEKARLIAHVLARCVGNPKRLRVLDVGCGIGLIDQDLEHRVGALCGVDTSLRSLDLARARAPATHFVRYDGTRLPVADGSFDVAFASCVLHHIPPTARQGFITEMLRPLQPNGAVLVIEHNPFNPVTRRIVARCAWDVGAVLLRCSETMRLMRLAGAEIAGRRYIGFSPLRSPLIEQAEHAIGWLPIGAQYCVWGIKTS
jgi:ubiquinone/menaquinone biosynthesis C-methylase UbiE